MGIEIERKFLVANDDWRLNVSGHHDIRQAYLSANGPNSVRVRIKTDAAFLTVKSAAPTLSRAEFEYEIPRADAEALLAMRTGRLIEKSAGTSCPKARCDGRSTSFPAILPDW